MSGRTPSEIVHRVADQVRLEFEATPVDVWVAGDLQPIAHGDLVLHALLAVGRSLAARLAPGDRLYLSALTGDPEDGRPVYLAWEAPGSALSPQEWDSLWLPGLKDARSSDEATTWGLDAVRAAGVTVGMGSGASGTTFTLTTAPAP